MAKQPGISQVISRVDDRRDLVNVHAHETGTHPGKKANSDPALKEALPSGRVALALHNNPLRADAATPARRPPAPTTVCIPILVNSLSRCNTTKGTRT
jgi:hypothetical protein